MKRARAMAELKLLKKYGNAKKMRLAAEGWRESWQTLIAITLSARTRDEVAVVAAEKLFRRFPTLEKLSRASARDISECIKSVNFFNNKTRQVYGCARTLTKEFGGNVPRSREELITIPGVGRKTANVFLAEMGGDAIGVDTHVAYISRALGWTVHSKPEKIERDLLALFPHTHWSHINTTCVRFGKTYLSRRQKDDLLKKISRDR